MKQPDRAACDRLRDELGITEGDPREVTSAREIRALRYALRLSQKEMAARLGFRRADSISMWEREVRPVAPRNPDARRRLLAMLVRAQELDVLTYDPGAVTGIAKGGTETLVRFRCKVCGKPVRRKYLIELPDGYYHLREGEQCGPLAFEDRRLKRMNGGEEHAQRDA